MKSDKGFTMNYFIRKSVCKDKPVIEELFSEMLRCIYQKDDVDGYEDGYLDRFYDKSGNIIFVAEAEKNVIAFVSVEKYEDFIYLDDGCVKEKHRNKGIGTALLNEAERYAKIKGLKKIILHVEKSNISAQRLYKRLGFITDSEENTRIKMIKTI